MPDLKIKRSKDPFDFSFDFGLLKLPTQKNNTISKKSKLKQNVIGKHKHKHKTNLFLLENDIRKSIFSKSAFKILQNILSSFDLPKKNEQLRIRTQKQINLISLVLKVIEKHKIIDELTIATYTLNRTSIETIKNLLSSKKIKRVNLLISSSYSFRDKKYFQELKTFALNLSKKYRFHLTFVWSHIKITLIKCGEDYYQFEGSMNYSTNNMAENLLFENNKETYDYDYKFINEIIVNSNKNKATEVIC